MSTMNWSVCFYIGVAILFSLSVGQDIADQAPAATDPSPGGYMSARFWLYSSTDQDNGKVVDGQSVGQWAKSFDDRSKVVMLVHGFQSTSDEIFLKIKNTLFNMAEPGDPMVIKPTHVVIVDWSTWATATLQLSTDFFELTGYARAANSTEAVGKQIGHFLVQLFQNGVNPRHVHLIGFSLGAHTAGWAGHYTQQLLNVKVGRISGLDPAGPKFEKKNGFQKASLGYGSSEFHLNRAHAHYVDIIHTSDVLGFKEAIGHVDFYPNGGVSQSCGIPSFLCSHSIAKHYFAASIHDPGLCKFEAVKCPSHQEFEKLVANRSSDCSNHRLNMGYFSASHYQGYSANGGKYYLYTHNIFPYCHDKPKSKLAAMFFRLKKETPGFEKVQSRTFGPSRTLCAFVAFFALILTLLAAIVVAICKRRRDQCTEATPLLSENSVSI
ncbi:Lipase member H [Halotydeus destructor]|nr:Lipase member H [Halotydeus destructor]